MFDKKEKELERYVKNLEKLINQYIAETVETRDKLDSLAKELGYEYKSRAVKKTNSYEAMLHCDPSLIKEEAVLEWVWERDGGSEVEADKDYDAIFDTGFAEGCEYMKRHLATPKKSSKKKLK